MDVRSHNQFTNRIGFAVQKLTPADLTEIVRLRFRGHRVTALAAMFGVSRQRVLAILRYYRHHTQVPDLRQPGRTPRPVPPEDVFLVLACHRVYDLGPLGLERLLASRYRKCMSHRIIYRVLRDHGLIRRPMPSRKRPQWVRFERDHAMSLGQGDWKQVTIDGRRR